MLRLRHDRLRLVGSFAQPILFLLVFGGGLSGPMGALAPGLNFTRFLYPGVVGMTVLMTAFMSGVSLVWEREMGFLKEVLVAPVPRASVALGKILGGATVAMVQGSLVLVLAPVVGVSLSLTTVLQLLPLMLLVAASLGALGVLLASRMYSMEGFQVIMGMLVMPMVFLSGVFFPVQNLPAWLNFLVRINPVTYGVDAIRQVMLGPLAPTTTLFQRPMTILIDSLLVAAFGLVMGVLAARSLSRQE